MLSCDTLALSGSFYASGHNTLVKNSDRPLGEAQPLAFFPAASYPTGEQLSCTHLTIRQAESTYAVLGCKPYWIWGFEMGANEKGLYIGNEAQGSRCEAERAEGLLGMDMLRLALERAATARQAMDVIAGLLEAYGQNANANMLYERRYENSFILTDDAEIWVMETAGRQWAAKKFTDYAAVSNCYIIEEDYDLCSENMEALARKNRWLSPNEPMNFAKAYTLPAIRQTLSTPHCRRMRKLVEKKKKALTETDVKAIFRDHFEGELIEPRFGACQATFPTICMHANTWDSAQTACSMLFTRDEVLGTVMRYAPSLPCCSVYIPVYWTGNLPAAMTVGGEKFSPDSLWWMAERLAMQVSMDEENFGDPVREALSAVEKDIAARTAKAERDARALIAAGDREAAVKKLNALTAYACETVMEAFRWLSAQLFSSISETGVCGPRKEFLEAYAKRCEFRL